jgi:hypothetical protein
MKSILSKLIAWKKTDEDEQWAEKAVDILMKKLKNRKCKICLTLLDFLDNLLKFKPLLFLCCLPVRCIGRLREGTQQSPSTEQVCYDTKVFRRTCTGVPSQGLAPCHLLSGLALARLAIPS